MATTVHWCATPRPLAVGRGDPITAALRTDDTPMIVLTE